MDTVYLKSEEIGIGYIEDLLGIFFEEVIETTGNDLSYFVGEVVGRVNERLGREYDLLWLPKASELICRNGKESARFETDNLIYAIDEACTEILNSEC